MMRHLILVKWAKPVPPSLLSEIEALFHQALRLPGVESVRLSPACLTGEKRYDLLIEIKLQEAAALAAFDRSPIHQQWKQRYSHLLAHKGIFDG